MTLAAHVVFITPLPVSPAASRVYFRNTFLIPHIATMASSERTPLRSDRESTRSVFTFSPSRARGRDAAEPRAATVDVDPSADATPSASYARWPRRRGYSIAVLWFVALTLCGAVLYAVEPSSSAASAPASATPASASEETTRLATTTSGDDDDDERDDGDERNDGGEDDDGRRDGWNADVRAGDERDDGERERGDAADGGLGRGVAAGWRRTGDDCFVGRRADADVFGDGDAAVAGADDATRTAGTAAGVEPVDETFILAERVRARRRRALRGEDDARVVLGR